MYTQKSFWSLFLAGAVLTSACGDSKSSLNPVAPSAVVIGAQSETASSADAVSSTTGKGGNGGKPDSPGGNGNGNGGGGNGNGRGDDKEKDKGKDQPTVPTTPTPPGNVTPPGNTSPTAPTGKVQIEGLISAKGSSTITVNGQLVTVPSSAVIRHGSRQYLFSDLRVGDRVHVKATRMSGPALLASTLEATEVKLQNPGDGDDDGDDDDDDVPPTLLVSVTALDSSASETGPDLGAFSFSRSGDTTAALTVTFTLTGTATNGTDYQTVPLTVTFAAGQATANVLVVPMADATLEGSETVIVTVTDGASYDVGSPASATVTIVG